MSKEARARIRINVLLTRAGWRFFDDKDGPANIALEPHVKIKKADHDALGDDFENIASGFIDYLLLDAGGFPLAVLEAKAEKFNPLIGKEKARQYARSQNVRFVILSNGNLHYFWDIEHGNPVLITDFPTPASFAHFHNFNPDPGALTKAVVEADYIAITQNPRYRNDARWKDPARRDAFAKERELKFLRPYQLKAIEVLQQAVKDGSTRFLFEMATGTGKTLLAGAIIKLFLRTGNAKRVLFLVDRIELEEQARKRFVQFLKNDYTTAIYKEQRDDWRKAEIVVSTVQGLLANNKYKTHFSPTDFDLVISDEAHRSISGDSRAVFEHFVGYKLGLTATPKDYLKKVDPAKISKRDPREWKRRQLLDTYKTFGCESGVPTFRYSLLDGVRDGFLLNPLVVDARTEITTEMLCDQGYPYYGASGVVDHVADFIFDGDYFLLSEDGANLVARSTPIAFSVSGKVWVNNHAHVLEFEHADTQKHVEYYFNEIDIKDFVTGSAQTKLSQANMNRIPIPIPPLAEQREIVGELEAERALVEANVRLIARMEKKIQTKLSEVWGETPSEPISG